MVFNQSKKLKIICSLVILCTVAVMLIGGTNGLRAEENETLQIAPINPEFLNFRENPPENCYGYVPPPMDISHLDAIPAERAATSAALPSSFNWRDQGKVTPVKNQGSCGTCWIFGTTSILESAVFIGENISYDFSEQSVALCADRSWVYLYDDASDPCMAGGWSWLAAEVFIKRGAVLELCNSYNPSGLQCDGACVCDSCAPVKVVNGYRYVTGDQSQTALIKQAIYDHGPVTMAFYYDDAHKYAYPTYGTVYDSATCSGIGHLVSIIGWDDSVPHFETPGTGAWLVKNSWGTSWGNNGYFWLAYNSSCMTEIAYLNYNDYNPNEKLYYWDEASMVNAVGYSASSAWMANIFTSTQNGSLTYVDFWPTSNNAQYQIQVYLDGNIFDGLQNLATSQSGTCQECGYYSIPLTSPVSLANGQPFTIAVKMTTPGFNYPIPIEQVIPGFCEPPIQTEVSYCRYGDTDAWEDLATYGWNPCLRARVTTSSITVTSPNGGETWTAGSTQIIRWTYTLNPGAYVKIELFKGGVLNRTISSSASIGTGGSGSYSWAIPSTQASGTDYRVKITSTTNAAYTDTSNADFTIVGPPPSAPTLKSPASASTVSSLTPRLEWNTSSGAVSYGVQVSTSSSFTTLLVNATGITNLYYDIAPGLLKWNTTYYWRVNARDSFGSTSTWSSYRYFKTAVGPPPNVPSNLVATPVSSSQINLTWQDNSSDETGFKIERKTGTGSYSQITTVGAGVTNYSNTLLSASTTYYYRVRAYSAAGNSAYSNEASTATPPPPPSAPTLKSPAIGSTVATLTPRLEWNASSGAVSYGVQVSTSSSFTTLLVNETGITSLYYDVAPWILKWNTTYYWRVNARNSYGSTSSWSTSRYFKTAVGPPPNAPSDLTATPVSSSQINLTWQDNSSDESGFKIERRTGTGSYSQIATVGANVTSYTNSRLSANTTYYYRVRAYNAAGNSNYSNEASVTTLPPPPTAPILKSPVSGSTVTSLTPRLEWNASSGAVSYGVQVSTSSSFASLLVNETGITNLYYDVAPWILKWNTTYYWRVNARNSFGSTSSWSTSRYFKTTGIPGPFTLTISSTAGGSVTIPGEGTFTYNAGTVVSLVATPASGYHFANWTGDVGTIANINAASTNITMNGAYSITANFEEGEAVTFLDPNLEAVVREAISKPTGPIYASDLEGLTSLNAHERNITDITGLEHCTNLKLLGLWSNNISDIAPLANLTNLTMLGLWSNNINNIAPLGNLTNLTFLNLWNINISDIAPLANLTNLTTLSLGGNQISDITPLGNLTNLTYLDVGGNQISDIAPLGNLTNLTSLGLWSNNINDITPLGNLTNLTSLNLWSNNISDIGPLVQNGGLGTGDQVDLVCNPLSSDSINIYIPQLRARGVTVNY
jgi:C1A family cysteine protease/transcriptional regulator CtsR